MPPSSKSHAGQLATLKLRYSVLRELHTTTLERLARTEQKLQEMKAEIDSEDIEGVRRFLASPATRTGPQASNMEPLAYDLVKTAYLVSFFQHLLVQIHSLNGLA